MFDIHTIIQIAQIGAVIGIVVLLVITFIMENL